MPSLKNSSLVKRLMPLIKRNKNLFFYTSLSSTITLFFFWFYSYYCFIVALFYFFIIFLFYSCFSCFILLLFSCFSCSSPPLSLLPVIFPFPIYSHFLSPFIRHQLPSSPPPLALIFPHHFFSSFLTISLSFNITNN